MASLDRHAGRILLMDDEEAIREVIGKHLRTMGYDVAVAREGNEAIALYHEASRAGEPFVATILDVRVDHGMDGLDTVTHLKAIDPSCRAIAFCGGENDPVGREYRQYGFTGIMPIPYSMQSLSETLDSIIDD